MVTETLENDILIQIDAPNESYFNADFKYISFIKFNHTHQKLGAWENLADFRKKGKDPLKVIIEP
jgi:hypothetical protein